MVIRVLRQPALASLPGTRFPALGLTAKALFVRVLRRGDKTLLAMMTLPFSATFHAAKSALTIRRKEEDPIEENQEEEIFLIVF
jgi:hypothetical protein